MARPQTNDVSFSNGKPVAVLVDGGFFHKRYGYVIQKRDEPKHEAVMAAKNFYTMCLRHAYGESLYRIFYYDCPPLRKKVHAPVSHRAIDFARSPLAGFRIAFLNELKKKRKVAIRLGELAGHSRWVIKPQQTKNLLDGSLDISELTDRDLFYDVAQKGVDMKIGLDIASLAYKQQVGRIVLIAGDCDFVPAAKLARREGIDFVLDPMWQPIPDSLFEHIDGLKSTWPKPGFASEGSDTSCQN